MDRAERSAAFDAYIGTHFRRIEGEQGVRNLEQLVETLGYGHGIYRNRAIEEFLIDNPGAVEAVLQFIGEWTDRNEEWAAALLNASEE